MWKRRFFALTVALLLSCLYPALSWWLRASEVVERAPSARTPPRPTGVRPGVGPRPPPPKTLAHWPEDGTVAMETTHDGRCSPRLRVAYVKTHKTASSTLQNIVYRWGERHNLTFALPASGVHIRFPLTRQQLVPSPTGTYDTLANHVRFEPKAFRELLPPDAAYITILRDPRNQFESYYDYFHCHSDSVYGASLTHFLQDPHGHLNYALYTHRRNPMCVDAARNPQLYDLGFDSALSGRASPAQGWTADEWIELLGASFHLVLIADHFLESLVALKHALCWEVDDVVALDMNRRLFLPTLQPSDDIAESAGIGSEDHPASSQSLDRLIARWNTGDVKLYRHFNRTLWRRLDQIGRVTVDRDVAAIQARTVELVHRCVENIEWLSATEYRTKTAYQTPLNNIVGTYTLRSDMSGDPLCQRLVLPAPNYLDYLRRRMKGQT